MWEQIMGVLSVLFMLVVFIAVLALAYYATKIIGKRYSPEASNAGNIKVLDRAVLGQDRSLIIVKVADQTMLIGTTPQHIEKICDLDADKLVQSPIVSNTSVFSDTLKNVLKNNWGLKLGTHQEENKEKSYDE